MRRFALAAAAVALVTAGCQTNGLFGHDEFEAYTRRADTLTMDSGAARANAVTHTITPWPGYVMDRRIPMDGARAAKAVECYRKGPAAKNPTITKQTDVAIDAKIGTAVGQSTTQAKFEC